MEIGAILIVAAIFIFVVGFVIKPLIDKDSIHQVESSGNLSHLLAERDRLMTAILELDFDNEIGKVPEDVFKIHRDDLSARTVNVMKELDEIGFREVQEPAKGKDMPDRIPVDEIEKMIRARRAASGKSTSSNFCSECGTKIEKGDKFCTSCGNAQ